MSERGARGVLLVNLGSPDSTRVRDVRRYLHQFLMDPFVIDVGYLLRKFIVCCLILPRRPKHTAAAYRSIWSPQGSPLVATSRRVQDLLGAELEMPVELAMRYGSPSIETAVRRLLSNDPAIDEIFTIPLYPQYAQATVQTAQVELDRVLRRLGTTVSTTIMPPFYAEPSYLDAMVCVMQPHLTDDVDHVLFSYHGIPEKHVRKSDPTGNHCLATRDCCHSPSIAHDRCYRAHCMKTTEAIVQKLVLSSDRYSNAFQSRLGKDPWLEPYTDHVVVALAESGVRNLLVVCPSFVSDCLETLEEIGIRETESFQKAGGSALRLVPCLNDHPRWIAALKQWCLAR